MHAYVNDMSDPEHIIDKTDTIQGACVNLILYQARKPRHGVYYIYFEPFQALFQPGLIEFRC